VVISEAVKEKLKKIAVKQKSSLFSSMLSAFYMYFAELTGQEDITFGIAGSGRDYAGLENIFGYFVNTIVLHNNVNKEKKYQDFLEGISGSVLDALKYQDYPLELIIGELKIKYPSINVFINMPNMFGHHGERLKDQRPCHSEDINDVKFDMEFYLIEYADGIEIVCTYAREYFDPKVVEYMVNEYVSLLSRISEDPTKIVADYFN
jgi:non-ribosomal peptide synthetase component F